MTFRALLELAVVLVAVPVVLSQQLYPSQRVDIGNCPQLRSDSDIFGNRTAFSKQGLLPSLFISGDGSEPQILRILRVHQLCEAIGASRNTASSVAYLVEYEIPSDTTPRLAQVLLDCIADTFNPAANYSFYPLPQPGAIQQTALNTARNSLGDTLVTDSSQILSNFSTPTAYMCGQCGQLGGIFVDQATRCVFCHDCTEGMRRCLGRDSSDQCCAWFLSDRCVQFCPSPLVGNPDTFDCGCSPLNITGGTVTYSDDFLIGSVATSTCDETSGYVLTAGSPANRTCTINGWTGVEATCSLFDCEMSDLQKPKNGDFSVEDGTTTFGSVVTFTCNNGYQLNGVARRTCDLNGWSGENPTCSVFDCKMNDLKKPENGEYTLDSGTTTFGSVVTFKCSDTYKLNGAATRTCGLNGWSGANPTCDKDGKGGLPPGTLAAIIVPIIVVAIIIVIAVAILAVVLSYARRKAASKPADQMKEAITKEE